MSLMTSQGRSPPRVTCCDPSLGPVRPLNFVLSENFSVFYLSLLNDGKSFEYTHLKNLIMHLTNITRCTIRIMNMHTCARFYIVWFMQQVYCLHNIWHLGDRFELNVYICIVFAFVRNRMKTWSFQIDRWCQLWRHKIINIAVCIPELCINLLTMSFTQPL